MGGSSVSRHEDSFFALAWKAFRVGLQGRFAPCSSPLPPPPPLPPLPPLPPPPPIAFRLAFPTILASF